MSTIAGIDYSTHAIDIVLIDEDTDRATWHRFPLEGANAFDRTRSVRDATMGWGGLFEDVLAIGIEDPRGYNAGALYRIQGAILARLRTDTLVHPLIPSSWRKTVGLAGNAPKEFIAQTVRRKTGNTEWPQDACDAYCIALATRTLLVRTDITSAETILG